jgi:hypothetical protein
VGGGLIAPSPCVLTIGYKMWYTYIKNNRVSMRYKIILHLLYSYKEIDKKPYSLLGFYIVGL